MRVVASCKRVSELLSQAQDRRLSLREKAAVHVHLLLCAACRRFVRHLDFIRTAVRRYIDSAGPR